MLDKEAHAEWQEALRCAARRLEAAWLALEDELAREARRWAPEIAALAAWRPPLWPLVALWAPLAAALVWLSLALAICIAARLFPSPLGLTAAGQSVLGVVAAGVVLWVSEAVPLGLTTCPLPPLSRGRQLLFLMRSLQWT